MKNKFNFDLVQIVCLKVLREDAFLDSAERPFHSFVPRNEKHFWPFVDIFFGTLRSVFVFLREWIEHCEFLLKRLSRYRGAKSLSDLNTIVLASLSMSCWMVFHPNLSISGLLGASKLLFVRILAALFWSFCSWFFWVIPQQPQTEQQYQKWGSTILV